MMVHSLCQLGYGAQLFGQTLDVAVKILCINDWHLQSICFNTLDNMGGPHLDS